MCKLWATPTDSDRKRRDTLVFLGSRDEALTPDQNRLIAKPGTPPPQQREVFVTLSHREAKRVKMNKARWHWMKNNGFKPTLKGWQSRLVGVELPAAIFG